MKRLVPLVLVGLFVAACGDSIDSDGEAPGGGAGSDSEQVSASTERATTEPASTESGSTDVDTVTTHATDSVPTVDVPATTPPEPTATGPEEIEPPASAVPPSAPTQQPTDRIVRFFAGDGAPGSPWAPIGHWDGTGWQDLRYADDGTLVPLPTSPIPSVAASSLDLPDGADAVITGLTLGAEQPYCVGDEAGPVIELPATLPDTPTSLGYDAVAVTADWPLQPRSVRQAGLQVPEYATIGAEFLSGQVDSAGDGSVVQAVRVDLDGNGVEEVLVTYERQQAGDFGGVGDFTSIYVRYPFSDGSVVDELLVEYVSSEPVDFPTPGRYTIAAVADLNGDSVMEVMVRDRFWESGGMQVFALADGRLTRVASGGCGV